MKREEARRSAKKREEAQTKVNHKGASRESRTLVMVTKSKGKRESQTLVRVAEARKGASREL